jgi:hypothetical protein
LEVEKFKKSLGISIWCSLLLFFNVCVSWTFACKGNKNLNTEQVFVFPLCSLLKVLV